MAGQNYYYSGQGSLLVATRDVNGVPQGFVPLGNVPELTLAIEVTEVEHKESETGQRLVDQILTTQKKGTFNLKLENLSLENLALAAWGAAATVPGGSVVGEVLALAAANNGKKFMFAHPNVSAVSVEDTAGAAATARANTTAYTLGNLYVPAVANAHFYKCTVAGTSAGTPPTFPVDGTTVVDGTATFQDMGLIIKSSTTDYTLDAKNGGITILAAGTIPDTTTSLTVDYTYAGYAKLDALTQVAAPERWLRFEGMNTVDGSFVAIDLFKARFSPMSGYALLGDKFEQLDMKGALLADTTRPPGTSQFFQQRNLG